MAHVVFMSLYGTYGIHVLIWHMWYSCPYMAHVVFMSLYGTCGIQSMSALFSAEPLYKDPVVSKVKPKPFKPSSPSKKVHVHTCLLGVRCVMHMHLVACVLCVDVCMCPCEWEQCAHVCKLHACLHICVCSQGVVCT